MAILRDYDFNHPMLSAHQLSCQRGDRLLFAGLDLALPAGGLLKVQGDNGTGKTSLLRLLCGLMLPAAGEVRFRGASIREQRDDFHRELVFLGHAPAVKDEFSALENIQVAESLAGRASAECAVMEALGRMGLAGREHLPAKVLSAGQRRRVALSRLLLAGAALWVLDEPFTALDKSAVAMLCEVMAAHLDDGGAIVLTTHQEVDLPGGMVQELRLGR